MSKSVLLFGLSFLAVTFGAMNSVLASSYLPDILRELLGSTDEATAGRVGAWINFAFLAGGTVGGIALGFLSDRIGRRAVLALAVLFYGIGSGLGAMATSWEILALTRVLVGTGVGAALVVSAVVLSENWPERSRAVALGLLSVAYPVGVIASGTVTSGVSDWRVGFGIGALAVLLAWPILRFVPEAEGWKTRPTDAQPPTFSSVRANLFVGVLTYGTMLIGIWSAFSWLPTWVQSLLGPDSPEGQAQRGLAVMLLGMGGLVGGILSGFFANRFGGRAVQIACFALCFGLSFLIFQTKTGYGLPAKIGIALLGWVFGVSQGVLNDYIPALFPPTLRSSATGLCFHIGRAFTAAAVFFVGAFAVWFGGYGNAIFAFSTVYLLGLAGLVFGKTRPV